MEHVHFECEPVRLSAEREQCTEQQRPPETRPVAVAADEGNYDILPLIRVDDVDGTVTQMTSFGKGTVATVADVNANLEDDDRNEPRANAVAVDDDDDDDGIPFIDAESPRKPLHVNYHEQRFITIQPQNVGSACLRESASAAATSALRKAPSIGSEPAAATDEPVEKVRMQPHHHRFTYPTPGTPVHARAVTDERVWFVSARRPQVEHHFQVFGAHERRRPTAAKLCQVCHEFLTTGGADCDEGGGDGDNVVRCLTCAFVCHEACVQVSEPNMF